MLANDVAAAMKAHLAREEQDVLPALRKHLSRSEKCALVWKSLQALPLRLLERIMPWVALHIGTQVRPPPPCTAQQAACSAFLVTSIPIVCHLAVTATRHGDMTFQIPTGHHLV